MVEITWQDPPPKNSRSGINYEPIIDELKKHPGKWGLINAEWAASSAPAVFRQKGCETTTRRNKGKDTWSFYARYPLPEPRPQTALQQRIKTSVEKGTALTPPPAAKVRPANDMGLTKFLDDRRARGVPDRKE